MSGGRFLKMGPFDIGDGFAENVPSVPVFDVLPKFEVVERDFVVCLQFTGVAPKLEDMKGICLVMTELDGGGYCLGGVHHRWLNGMEAPFKAFVLLPNLPFDIGELCRKYRAVEVVVASSVTGFNEGYLFSFIERKILRNPPFFREYLEKHGVKV